MFDTQPALANVLAEQDAVEDEKSAKKPKEEFNTISPSWSVLTMSGASLAQLPRDPLAVNEAFNQAAQMTALHAARMTPSVGKPALTIPSLEDMMAPQKAIANAVDAASKLTQNQLAEDKGRNGDPIPAAHASDQTAVTSAVGILPEDLGGACVTAAAPDCRAGGSLPEGSTGAASSGP